MSFVHCPSCHRAFDLRRQLGCPHCARRAAPDAAPPRSDGELVVIPEPVAAPDPVPVRASTRPEVGSVDQRIVAMVAELAALVDQASTAELEAAQQQLHRRGIAAPWSARWLVAGERLVTRVLRSARGQAGRGELELAAPEATARPGPSSVAKRLAGRLRSAWAELGSPPA